MATIRQRLLRAFYPLLMRLSRKTGPGRHILFNERSVRPNASVYDLRVRLNNGQEWSLAQARGRKLLVVNTASDCGYTGQYAELQRLHESHGERLVILGVPANDFKEQERGGDADIAAFCQVNYGVQFLLAAKASVVRGPGQHPLFHWLSDATANGWNDQPPAWNFSKYLIDEEGRLTHYFAPSVSPEGEVRKAVEGSEAEG